MFQNLSVALKVVSAPVWLAWRAYQGLWWAFDDVPAKPLGRPAGAPAQPIPGAASAPGASVQVGGASDAKAAPVARPKPIKELKFGFASSTLLWFPAAYLAAWMHNMGWVSESGAVFGTLWTMAILWVASLVAVRRHVRNTPVKRTPLEAARSAFRAAREAPKAVAAKAAGTVRGLAAFPMIARAALAKVKGAVPSKLRVPAGTATVNGDSGLRY